MVGFGEPVYTKSLSQIQHKRFILTQQGDPLENLETQMVDYEQSQSEKLKQQHNDLLKQMQANQQQKQTKA